MPSHPAPNQSITSPGGPPIRSTREVVVAISGLMIGMFVALISSTVITPSLPHIVTDLGGDQAAFTWIVTATLLAMTVTTPIWGKLSDLISRKLLVQIALAVYTTGSILSGFAQDTTWLIVTRAIQGLGIGGLMALVQIVIADLISPRERGKYMGIVGAVMGVGMVGGPLIGGPITDGIGWRWNFWIFVPIAVVALFVIQRTLHLPPRPPREIKVDYLGAALITGGVATLLLWVSFAGTNFPWWSWTTVALVGLALLALLIAVLVELRVAEPIIPLHLFEDRTFTLAVVGSIAVGIAMFGTSLFLSQYMQFARGATPTQSGLMILPMIVGQMGGGIVIGQLISRTGKWKRYVVGGSIFVVLGLALMGTIHYDTHFAYVSLYMFVLGLGMGAVMQNLVLVVQNSVSASHMGAASAGVTFFRSLGGTIGVAALGAFLGQRVPALMQDGVTDLAIDPSRMTPDVMAALQGLQSGTFPDLASTPEAVRVIIESAYGNGIAEQFLLAVPVAIVAAIAVSLLPNKPLSRKTAAQKLTEEAENFSLELAEAYAANDSTESADAELTLTGPLPVVDDGAPASGERTPAGATSPS